MGSYYAGIMNSDYSRELRHHGIIGQKWGVQNGPPYPINEEKSDKIYEKSLKEAMRSPHKNLDSWGSDPKHNVLYVTGYSGSGKSTAALALANKHKNTSIIHLDRYVDGMDVPKNKDFERYMDSNAKGWREMTTNPDYDSKDYWEKVDKFTKAIEKYGEYSFRKGKPVIAEGVQIMDEWWGDHKYLSDKPVILMRTNSIISEYRASKRDSDRMRPGVAVRRIFDKSLNQQVFRKQVGI